MKRMKITVCLGMMLGIVLPMVAHAETIRFVTAEFPPLTRANTPDAPGLIVEQVQEAAKRAGVELRTEFLPWKRAQDEALSNNDVIIAPFAKTPEREPKYQWISLIFKSPYGFISLKPPAVDSFADALKLDSVGVSAGTNYEEMLRQNGFGGKIQPSNTENNARKIVAGRIDAWYDGFIYAADVYKKIGESTPLLYGKPIGFADNYIASSPQFPKPLADKLNAAITSMREDGTFAKLQAKYGVPQ
jgi:polar amino acid transport system substrate-binding protein